TIFITGDNPAQAALPAIVKLGEDNKIPVFTSDYSSVKQGAVATYNFLEDDLGKQTADMTVRVLKGEKPGDIAVEGPKNFKVIINPGAAAKMGIKIPDSVTKKADVVIQ
ncbi:MAG: ABC transporter substrate-binding protein, partial [Chloroflexota bacterium]